MLMNMDPIYWIIVIFIMIVGSLASGNVKRTFAKYSKVPVRRGMTGAQAARYILDSNGLQNVVVERVPGELTDHYDPAGKVLRLSQSVYDSPSISAVGVAAHETGHALQDKTGYWPLVFRQSFYPVAQLGSNLGMMLILLGFLLGQFVLLLGVLLYAAGVILTVVTLPVEFNASNRALQALTNYGLVTQEEYNGTKKVLNAAAMTYVAAAVGAVLILLYYVSLFMGSRDE